MVIVRVSTTIWWVSSSSTTRICIYRHASTIPATVAETKWNPADQQMGRRNGPGRGRAATCARARARARRARSTPARSGRRLVLAARYMDACRLLSLLGLCFPQITGLEIRAEHMDVDIYPLPPTYLPTLLKKRDCVRPHVLQHCFFRSIGSLL